MSDLELCYMPASEALKRFRAKKLSPIELMEAVIARAEATKDKVNAFTNTHFDEAMALAKKAEAKYAKDRKTGALVFRAGMAYEKAVGGWYGEKAHRPKL